MMAVAEGLYVDGAKPETVRALAADKWEIFVPKCPIRMPGAARPRDRGCRPAPRHVRQPRLRPSDRDRSPADRQGPAEALVKRYVERRFALVKMTDVEQARMRRLLKEGRKSGTSMMNPRPDDVCPSCEGAARR